MLAPSVRTYPLPARAAKVEGVSRAPLLAPSPAPSHGATRARRRARRSQRRTLRIPRSLATPLARSRAPPERIHGARNPYPKGKDHPREGAVEGPRRGAHLLPPFVASCTSRSFGAGLRFHSLIAHLPPLRGPHTNQAYSVESVPPPLKDGRGTSPKTSEGCAL